MRVRRAVAVEVISIHALREEGDGGRGLVDLRLFDFYPRPPRGGRPVVFSALPALAEFLSTPSARRVTVIDGNNAVSYEISIHALREEGDFLCRHSVPPVWSISIHALREEGDSGLTGV